MPNRQQRFLFQAAQEAEKSVHRYPMGAVLVQGSRIIHRGYNKAKSHPRQQEAFNPRRTIHAELAVLIGLPEEAIEGSDVHIVRLLADGNVGMAKPCVVCHRLLATVGVRNVYFSIESKDLNLRDMTYGHLILDEYDFGPYLDT